MTGKLATLAVLGVGGPENQWENVQTPQKQEKSGKMWKTTGSNLAHQVFGFSSPVSPSFQCAGARNNDSAKQDPISTEATMSRISGSEKAGKGWKRRAHPNENSRARSFEVVQKEICRFYSNPGSLLLQKKKYGSISDVHCSCRFILGFFYFIGSLAIA